MSEKACFCKKKRKVFLFFFKVVPHNNDDGGKPWFFPGILWWHARAPKWDRKKVEGWVWNVHSREKQEPFAKDGPGKSIILPFFFFFKVEHRANKDEMQTEKKSKNYRSEWLDESPINELLKINRCNMWQQIYNLLFIFDIKLLELLTALRHDQLYLC